MDTTVGALKVGAQLVMGKYGVDKDNPYPIVWLKGNPNCDFITEKAIDFKRKGIRPNPTADLFDLKARYAGLDSDRGFMSFWLLDDVETERAAISNRSGVLNRLTASSCSGVRPVCTLNPDTIVEQREAGVFFIKPFTTQNVFTDEELFELLGMAQP